MKIEYGTLEEKFVESKLIAYIGNKRRLIKLIVKALERCKIDTDDPNYIPIFYDPFAGTGVVSRLAKTQGFKVISNDWEYYSFVINKLYIEMDDKEVEKVFSDLGGIKKVIKQLNKLPALPYEESYITKYYCPKDTECPDIFSERLFYTRETGEKIDAIREEIDKIVNNDNSISNRKKKLYTLLAPLLYEVSSRSNTSGVFKAYHNGFGGSNGDALTRIFKKLIVEKPILWKNMTKHKVYKADAVKLSRRLKNVIKADVTYIDPPYNQHQYGSNYHLLNTVAYNDKPPINKEIYIEDKKINKSGIRKDWSKTKSGFCYKSTATQLFEDLIQNINSKYILVSYSIDGIIDFDKMIDILIEKGSVDIVTSQYVKYPGGKQSLKREVNNVEFVLIVNTTIAGKKEDKQKIYSKLTEEKIPLYLGKTTSIMMIETLGYTFEDEKNFIKTYSKQYANYKIEVDILNDYCFYENGKTIRYINKKGNPVKLHRLPLNIKKEFLDDLKKASDLTKEDELNILLSIILKNAKNGNYDIFYKYLPRIPYLLNKFNNRKAYESSLNMIMKIMKTLVKIEASNLEKKRMATALKRLDNIVKSKLNHQNSAKRNEKLKKNIREYYSKVAKKYEIII